MDALNHLRLGKPAIATGNHVFAAHQARIAHDAVSHQLGMFHGDGVVADYSWNKDLARGQFLVLPDPPFMFVPNISCFDGISACPHLQNQIDDFFERCIRDMRHVPTAEAHVISYALFRDSRKRVVQRLNAQIGPLTIFFGTLLNQMIVHVGQDCIVHLEKQPAS